MNRIYKTLLMGLAVVSLLGFGKISTTKADAAPGSLIKMNGLSSVYYLGQDGKRYVFPSQNVYFSWYKDFSGVVTISQSELESYPLGANITMRPGTRLVKITTNPKVYAVEPGGSLRAIPDEATAEALYGPAWNKRIDDIADAFFTNYKMGDALASSEVPAGSLVKNEDSAAVYYYDGTNYRSIADEAAFNANRFSFDHVLTIDNKITAGGSSITGNEFANPDASATGQGTQPGQGTGLTVALSANTPASASVPKNGTRVLFTKVNLTASADGALSISSIKVNRIGLSNKDHFSSVWAEKDGVRITSKRSVNSNDEALLTFVPALNIPAGQTISLGIVASLNDATGNGGLAISAASDIATTNNATVIGSFPITGNLMSFAEYVVTEAQLSNTLTDTLTVKVGDENIDLAGFSVKASGTKSIILKNLTLKNNKNANLSQVVNDLYIERSGVKVANGTISSDKNVTFVFVNDGFKINRNETEIFKIKGSIIDMDSGNNKIQFKLDNKEDFVIVEDITEFTSPVNSTPTFREVTIEAGAVNISKKTTSPAEANYIRGTKNVVALIANIKVDQAIKAESLSVKIDNSSNNLLQYVENIRVYVNNNLLDSVDPVSPYNTTPILFDTQFDLNAGNNEVKVVYDINSEAAADNKELIVYIDNTSLGSLEYVSSGDTVDGTSVVHGTATGSLVGTKSASLTAVQSDGYSASSVVKGSTVSLGKITTKAINDSLTITAIEISGASGHDIPYSEVSDMKLYIDGIQIGDTRDWTATGSSFNNLSIQIAKDANKVIELKGTFDSAATTGKKFKAKFSFIAEDSNSRLITVSDQPETVQWTVSDSGSLSFNTDADTPSSAILVANSSNNSIAKFKLASVNDTTKVTEIYMTNLYGAGADSRINEVRLMKGSTVLDTDVPINGQVHFNIPTNGLNIDKDGNVVVEVQVSLNQISSSEQTNKAIEFVVTKVKASGSNNVILTEANNPVTNFIDSTATLGENIDDVTKVTFAISDGTKVAVRDVIKINNEEMLVTKIEDNDITVIRGINNTTVVDTHVSTDKVYKVAGVGTNKEFRVRKTIPTVNLLDLPTTALGAGEKTIAKFTVTADSNEDVNIKQFKLDIGKPENVLLTVGKIKINNETKEGAYTTINLSNGTILFANNEVVAAGTTKTFEVIATVNFTSATGYNYLNTKFAEATEYVTTPSNAGSSSFEWNDNSSSNYTDYFGSYRVIGLPTNPQQLEVSF